MGWGAEQRASQVQGDSAAEKAEEFERAEARRR